MHEANPTALKGIVVVDKATIIKTSILTFNNK